MCAKQRCVTFTLHIASREIRLNKIPNKINIRIAKLSKHNTRERTFNILADFGRVKTISNKNKNTFCLKFTPSQITGVQIGNYYICKHNMRIV